MTFNSRSVLASHSLSLCKCIWAEVPSLPWRKPFSFFSTAWRLRSGSRWSWTKAALIQQFKPQREFMKLNLVNSREELHLSRFTEPSKSLGLCTICLGSLLVIHTRSFFPCTLFRKEFTLQTILRLKIHFPALLIRSVYYSLFYTASSHSVSQSSEL